MHLRRFLYALLACFALGPPLFSQSPQPAGLTGSLCTTIAVDGKATVGIQVGPSTWSGTLQAQVQIGQSGWTNISVTADPTSTTNPSPQATMTANGNYSAYVSGKTSFQVCGNTVASGTATIVLNPVQVSNRGGSGGSGGSAFPVTVTGGVSGAVPYFSSTTTESSGAVLAANALVVGGGAGAAPSTGNGDFTYATHTLTMGAAGLLNLSAGATGAFILPVVAGCTSSANGVVCYDTTAGNTHQRTNAADSLSVGEAAALAANTIPKATDATHSLLTASSLTDNATTVTTAEAMSALSYTSTGASAGFLQYGQGSTASVGTTDITEQAPTAVTSYLVTKPGTAASGLAAGRNASGTITQNFTGSSAYTPTAVTIGTGTSIAATSLCSTTNCPAGNYQVNVYVEVTTACTTTGAYSVWLGYTDDAGAKTGSATTTSFPLTGNGTTPITSSAGASLVPTSTTDYATGQYFIHTTGAATSSLGSINYGTTATACGTGGPMVGQMFLTVVPLS